MWVLVGNSARVGEWYSFEFQGSGSPPSADSETNLPNPCRPPNMDRAKALVGIGIVILLVGVALPSFFTSTETSCTEHEIDDGTVTCEETTDTTTAKKNEYRIPVIVSGRAIGVVGAVFLITDR